MKNSRILYFPFTQFHTLKKNKSLSRKGDNNYYDRHGNVYVFLHLITLLPEKKQIKLQVQDEESKIPSYRYVYNEEEYERLLDSTSSLILLENI